MAADTNKVRKWFRECGESAARMGLPIDYFYQLPIDRHSESRRAEFEIGYRAYKADNKTRCPWCGSTKHPVKTDVNLANFQYSDPRHDKAAVARNPAMCPDCYGVGGWVDWGL